MEDVRQVDVRTGSNELIYILEKLVGLHRGLVDLLREEYGHMTAVDVKGISETAQSKEAFLAEIWNHEQLRIKTVAKLAAALSIADDKATLLAISEKLSAPESEKLRAARTALNLLVEQARDLNTKNMSFAQGSLDRIEQMKRNALGLNNTAAKENYSNSGNRQPITEQGGRLLSTEA